MDGACRRGTRDPGPSHRAAAGRRPSPAIRARTCAAAARTRPPGRTSRGSRRGAPSARSDGPTVVLGRPAGEGRPAGADRRGGVGVAVADPGQAVLLREPDDRPMAVLAQCRGVEGLDRVRASSRVVIGKQAPERGALGAHRERDERVSRDRDPALVVDRLDGPRERLEGGDGPLEEQPEQVAAAGADLLADDDLVRRPRSAAICFAATAASIRSWSAMAMMSRKPCASTWSRISARTTCRPRRACGCACRRGRAGRGPRGVTARSASGCATTRSGQIGWNAPHHCSGASARMVSKRRRCPP